MRIGVLTSSRADFGIYLPLLEALKSDSHFQVTIIAFGTHLSDFHGKTVNHIQDLGFEVEYKIESMLLSDSAESISTAIGLTTIKFAEFWKEHKKEFDLVFCLGDRYEMFAAVTAGISFQMSFAHIHGGETTLGAIDNIFRHSITLASKYHFVSTKLYGERVAELVKSDANIYYVGALGLDNIHNLNLLSKSKFKELWGVDLNKKTVLTTFHPETVAFGKNEIYADELIKSIHELVEYQFLITMPNADTAGNIIRNSLLKNFDNSDRVFLIENLGSQSYFTAIEHCCFLLGNTSSGIIEAASFGKYVINLGDRQKGRAHGKNVINIPVTCEGIVAAVKKIKNFENSGKENIYFNGGATKKITKILKAIK